MEPKDALLELMEVYRDQARHLQRADTYFRAEPNSVNIGTRVPPNLARFRTAWPAVRIATNAYADRVTLETIHFDDESAQEDFAPYALSLQSATSMAVLESLATGIGYLRTVLLDDGTVKFSAIRGQDGAFIEDLDTGELLAVMRVHRPRLQKGPIVAPAAVTVYTPGQAQVFNYRVGEWVPEENSANLPAGVMLMRPLINRARAGEPYGRAEGHDLYSLQDQGSRALTDLSIATDGLAVPQRVLLATLPESIQDLSQMKAYTDSILALSGDVKVDQWQAAQLAPFTETMNGLGRLASSVSGLAMSYWGLASDQAPSGDAIRENDARVELRSAEIAIQFTEPVHSLVVDATKFLKLTPEIITVKWKDPATPTPTAAADAAIKLAGIGTVNGQITVDREMIWDILRVDPASRARIIAFEEEAQINQLINPAPEGAPNATVGSPPGPEPGNSNTG